MFQVAKSLGINSKDILRKLIAEELPPPADRNQPDRQNHWTPRSQVSLGLAEVIREWHASGELKVLPAATADTALENSRRASRKSSGAQAPTDLDAIAQIEHEAQQKKHAQVNGLRQSRRAILDQLKDSRRQIDQIDRAMAAISGTFASAKAKGARRDLSDVREHMGRWLEAHRGEKFDAGTLAREFHELQGTAVSYVLKPLIEAGQVQVDASEGLKRPKYFASLSNETAITS